MRLLGFGNWALVVVLCGCGSNKAQGADTDAGQEASVPQSCDPSKPFGTATLVLDTPASSFRLGPDYLTAYFEDLASQDLFSVSRVDPTSPWGPPTLLAGASSPRGEDSAPSVTADGLKLYFASDRSGVAAYVYAATRTRTSLDFANPSAVDVINAVGSGRSTPFIREDDGALYFAAESDSNLELFRAIKTGPFFDQQLALTELNSPAAESSPVVTPDDKTIYFASQRADGNAKGDYDIWTASRSSASDPFAAPVDVEELDTDRAELVDFITRDGCMIFFHSDRDNGVFKLYSASKPR